MKNPSIAVANLAVSKKLKESYFNNDLLEESKKLTTDFFDIIKDSTILQLEFKVFNNIENKHIENDVAATRYIDNNIKLFEVYTIDEIDAEREKYLNYIKGNNVEDNNNKIKLYSSIDTLITESLNNYDVIDVDNIHESFTYVLNHIKQPKKSIVESAVAVEIINEDVIEIAIDKFNEKYDLNEDDKNLFNKLISLDKNGKKELLESYKKETLSLLENINKDNSKDSIVKAMQKINEMNGANSIDDDIISLHELKGELL